MIFFRMDPVTFFVNDDRNVPEMVEKIFGLLDFQSILNATGVSRKWNEELKDVVLDDVLIQDGLAKMHFEHVMTECDMAEVNRVETITDNRLTPDLRFHQVQQLDNSVIVR